MGDDEESAGHPREERLHQLTELGALLVLSVSALGSSYAGFQEGLWDGQQAAHSATALTAQTAASKEEMLAVQQESVNALHFTQWVNAYASGNQELESFYRSRFRPGFRTAFDQWIASRPRFNPDASPTPFDLPGYRQNSRAKSARLAHQAEQQLQAARNDMRVSDGYGQSVVIFALALFLGGIVQGFDGDRKRAVLVILGFAACLIGLVQLTQLPAIRLI